jgi:hypothetical protein
VVKSCQEKKKLFICRVCVLGIKCNHAGSEVITAAIIYITQCSPLKVNRLFGATSPPSSGSNKPIKIQASKWVCHLLSRWDLDLWCSSETSVDFQRTTRHYLPEDRTLHGCNQIQRRVEQCLVFSPLFTCLQASYLDALWLSWIPFVKTGIRP